MTEFTADGSSGLQTTPKVGSQGAQSFVSIPAVTGTMNTLAGSLTSTGLFGSNWSIYILKFSLKVSSWAKAENKFIIRIEWKLSVM